MYFRRCASLEISPRIVSSTCLESFSFFTHGVSFSRFFEHLACSFCFLLSLEHTSIDVSIHCGDIDLCLSCNHIRLRNSSQWDSIYFVRSCYQDEPGILKVFYKDDPLSLMTTSKKNDYGSWCQRLSQL